MVCSDDSVSMNRSALNGLNPAFPLTLRSMALRCLISILSSGSLLLQNRCHSKHSRCERPTGGDPFRALSTEMYNLCTQCPKHRLCFRYRLFILCTTTLKLCLSFFICAYFRKSKLGSTCLCCNSVVHARSLDPYCDNPNQAISGKHWNFREAIVYVLTRAIRNTICFSAQSKKYFIVTHLGGWRYSNLLEHQPEIQITP